MDQLVTIELFGHPFTFKADADRNKAKEVADYLVSEVAKAEGQLTGKSSTLTKRVILILAALNIANQYFELQKTHSDLLQNISDRSAALLTKMDRSLS